MTVSVKDRDAGVDEAATASESPATPRVRPRRSAAAYLRALRLHQWSKNLLLFLPMLAAQAVDLPNLGILAVAFLAFGLTASAAYLVNDLCDLASDRAHASKRLRPLAAGTIPVTHAVILAALLFAAGLGLAAAAAPAVLAVAVIYVLTTFAYSLALKRYAVIDVMTLAGLYTVRVFAGAAALGLPVSPWMLAFSCFLFLCLAIVKRYTELMACLASGRTAPAARGYRITDMPVLGALAAAAGYAAVVVLALYVNSDAVAVHHAVPEALWLVCILLLFWVSRVLLIAHRGEMHDDPIVFALTDWPSIVVITLTALVFAGNALL